MEEVYVCISLARSLTGASTLRAFVYTCVLKAILYCYNDLHEPLGYFDENLIERWRQFSYEHLSPMTYLEDVSLQDSGNA